MPQTPSSPELTIDHIYRTESRRIYATLIRLLGDMDLAEEVMHEAFHIALTRWQTEGVPNNPRAWLVSTARFKAIDQLRARKRHELAVESIQAFISLAAGNEYDGPEDTIEDDQLRLVFTCCHPALDPKVQVPLTLREVCGLTTEQIASAFLVSPTTMAQRIVRGKAKIRQAGLPFEIPQSGDIPKRLDAVLSVIYLVFNEGYSASAGISLMRDELCSEAIRLARLLYSLLPDAEVMGLLALMLLNHSRQRARTNERGDIILLEDQDRSLWDRSAIEEGGLLVRSALETRDVGFYTLQAAISATHANAPHWAATDWNQIVALYNSLLQVESSPVIELNQAVAIAMRDGPAAGLAIVERLLQSPILQTYHLLYSTYGELLRRTGDLQRARTAFERALGMTEQAPEQRVLRAKIASL